MSETNGLEATLIDAARRGDELAFRRLAEPLQRELLAFCYRMLGGFHDAEDAVQEAQLKAWRALAGYQPTASFRAWLYKIAANTCLDALRKRQRRVLPRDVGPAVPPGPPTTEVRDDIAWLEPYPDTLLPRSDPEAAVRQRESIRLAFVRALQLLPARQRAALILRDVLDWPASDVAAILETSVPAVNSALQRARATVAATDPAAAGAGHRLQERRTEAVARYVRAWETGDFDALVAMLAEDAIMSMPPWVWWVDGREAVAAAMTSEATWGGKPGPGRYRMVPTEVNGQPAVLAYMRGAPGAPYQAVCLTVIGLSGDGSEIIDMTTFVLSSYFAAWGYPLTVE